MTRRRCQRYLTWGGACICLATYLPWVIARHESGLVVLVRDAADIRSLPPITVGYVSLVLGVPACSRRGQTHDERVTRGSG
jgi:hypothetical protein